MNAEDDDCTEESQSFAENIQEGRKYMTRGTLRNENANKNRNEGNSMELRPRRNRLFI